MAGESAAASPGPTGLEVHQNERWFPVAGWGTRTLPRDPYRWTLLDGSEARVYNPEGWGETNEWVAGAWEYSQAFGPEAAFSCTVRKTDCVRRRLWSWGSAVLPSSPSHPDAASVVGPEGVPPIQHPSYPTLATARPPPINPPGADAAAAGDQSEGADSCAGHTGGFEGDAKWRNAQRVYQNERWFPLVGWGVRALLHDPHRWAHANGTLAEGFAPPGPASPPPRESAWEEGSGWVVGPWEYGLDFGPTVVFSPTMRKTDCVRRRLWFRKTVPLPATESPREGQPGSASAWAAVGPAVPALAGPLTATWAGGAAEFATLDGDTFRLYSEALALEEVTTAVPLLSVPLARVTAVGKGHKFDVGGQFRFTVALESPPVASLEGAQPLDGVTQVELTPTDLATREQWVEALRRGVAAHRPVLRTAVAKGAEVVTETVSQGARMMYASLGVGMAWGGSRKRQGTPPPPSPEAPSSPVPSQAPAGIATDI